MLTAAIVASYALCTVCAVWLFWRTLATPENPWYIRGNLVANTCVVAIDLVAVLAPGRLMPLQLACYAVSVACTAALMRKLTPGWFGYMVDDLLTATAVALPFWCLVFATTDASTGLMTGSLAAMSLATLWTARTYLRMSSLMRAQSDLAGLFLRSACTSQVVSWLLYPVFVATGIAWIGTVATVSFLVTGISLTGLYASRLRTMSRRVGPPPAAQPARRVAHIAGGLTGMVSLAGFAIEPRTVTPVTVGLCTVALVTLLVRNGVLLRNCHQLVDTSREREDHYRSLVQASRDVIMICDPETTLTKYVSPAAEQVLKLTEDVAGKPLNHVIGAPSAESHDLLRQTRDTGTSERVMGRINGQEVEAQASRCGSDVVVTVRDVTERERLRRNLQRQAYFDPLTNLANRTAVLQQIRESLQRAEKKLSVLFIDLDRFKQVNDASGHEAGDAVLVEVARRLTAETPRGVFWGRMGGDEFVGVVDRGLVRPEQLAKAIARSLSEPFHAQGRSFQLGVSVGITTPTEPVAPTEVLRQADVAMYAAKRRRTHFAVYDHEFTASTIAGVNADASVAEALRERDQRLELHFQPMIDLVAGDVRCVEALLRWRDHEDTLQAPAPLLEFARRSGQMRDLTSWVIATAFQHMQRAHPDAALSINLPPEDLLIPTLARTLDRDLRRFDVDPSRLILEITEDATIGQAQDSTKVLDALHDMGVRVMIDDFGSGFSSLGYLIDLPLDGIKIDRKFITALPSHPSARSILKSLISLAQDNNLTLVAEGVQSQEEDLWVRNLGSPTVQGYYYAKPQEAGLCGDLFTLSAWRE